MGQIPSKEEMHRALSERIGEKLQNRIADTTVAVCGLGGLGSNIALSLARAGIGKLILIDFDRVDITNLNRQQYKACQVGEYKTAALSHNLKEIAPYLEIETKNVRMSERNFASLLDSAQIVCEAFDSAEEKSALCNFVLEYMPEKFLVAASGMAGIGSPNTIRTRRITSHFYLCGDGESDVDKSGSLFSARVMLCAAHQAQTVLRIIAEEFEI